MTRDEVFAWTTQTMIDLFELDSADVTPDARLIEDLGLDSIDAIDMVVRLQEFSGRRIADGAMREVRTVSDVADLVESHLAGSS